MSEARDRLARARMLGERFVLRLEPDARPPTPDPDERRNAETPPAHEPASAEAPLETPAETFDQATWDTVKSEGLECTRCDLCESRTRVVWGSGTPRTSLMIVGEAPGYHEDQQGEAFVGRAGKLLTKILQAIDFERDEVFITNVLKCRPPKNADPRPHQVEACEPYLKVQIELIQPAAILTLGRHAARTLLRRDGPMKSFRGRVFRYEDVPLIATYHPAALLRNASLKRPTWEDVQLLRETYDEVLAARERGEEWMEDTWSEDEW